jgi:CubicO group peptidase (beta-lactamase class C family)
VIVQATVKGRPVISKAYGESMTGVPATTDMHFRNGAVAISYVSTLLLRLVDRGKVKLDDNHALSSHLGSLARRSDGTSSCPCRGAGAAPGW